MDVDDLQHALGGVVLESAEDCERITQHHTDIPGAEKERLLAALKACHQANSHRNRVIHDAWATRPGDEAAAFGPEWDLVEDQLRHELGRDVGAEGQRPDE